MLDPRLLACAELCIGGRAADVGTDHGYLAIELVRRGICESCIACDINEKPLASARENIKAAGLGEKISAVLSDGLDMISPDGVTNVVIAGMGGELIADILSRAEWVKQNRVNLVLQPMTKWDFLRSWLNANGFEVQRELPCASGKFVYSVMQAVYTGAEPNELSLSYLYCGKVSPETREGRAYLLRQASRLEAVGSGLGRDPQKAAEAQRFISAAKEITKLCEV